MINYSPSISKRISDRKTAIIVGALFIVGTVAGVLSVLTRPFLDDADYLIEVSANENQMIIGTLFILIMGIALALVPVFMLPILRKHNEPLALGYVVFRGALETTTYIASVIVSLVLLTLSQEFINAGIPDASHFQTSGELLKGADEWIGHTGSIVFSLGALMFYYLLYKSKLIPRWLSGWGFIGAIIVLVIETLGTFGSNLGILWVPLAIQEMVMAVWLIVKGFNSPPVVSEAA